MDTLSQSEMLKRLIGPHPDQPDGDPEWGNMLACPICGHSYVHLNDVEHRHDDQAWAGRGDAIYIAMSCEAGHGWTLRFGHHKGNTYLAVEGIGIALEGTGNF